MKERVDHAEILFGAAWNLCTEANSGGFAEPPTAIPTRSVRRRTDLNALRVRCCATNGAPSAVTLESYSMYPMKTINALVATLMLVASAGCASTRTHESAGEYVDDSAITTKVKTAILQEPGLKSSEISVETFKGVVQLSGFVGSRDDIRSAVKVASAVGGVKSVKNDMQLK